MTPSKRQIENDVEELSSDSEGSNDGLEVIIRRADSEGNLIKEKVVTV